MTSSERYRLVVRHGEYNYSNGSLTDHGTKDIQESAEELAHTLGGDAPAMTLISSPVKRAVETAELIAAKLGVDLAENEIMIEGFLRDDSPEVLMRREMMARIVEKIGTRAIGSADKLVVVTHLPQVIELANLGYLDRPSHGVFYRISED